MKLFYTLSSNRIISRTFAAQAELDEFRAWVEEQGGDSRMVE